MWIIIALNAGVQAVLAQEAVLHQVLHPGVLRQALLPVPVPAQAPVQVRVLLPEAHRVPAPVQVRVLHPVHLPAVRPAQAVEAVPVPGPGLRLVRHLAPAPEVHRVPAQAPRPAQARGVGLIQFAKGLNVWLSLGLELVVARLPLTAKMYFIQNATPTTDALRCQVPALMFAKAKMIACLKTIIRAMLKSNALQLKGRALTAVQ